MSGEVRSVVVRLSAAVTDYMRGMGQADAATAKVEHGLERLNKKTLTTDQTMGRIGKVGGRVFLGAAAGIAIAEKKAADFNSEMATVYTLSHANEQQQKKLAEAAKTVGVNIGYSATESAAAEEELIKAGVKLKDIMGGGLKGALDLAAAGQTDVGSATAVAASAMTQFKLKGKDVPHIADLLAAGADKALGSVTDLGYGLSQVGTQAHQMGFSIEETVGTLAEFAQSGLTGERGGTVLKQMFLQLAAPAKNAQALMDKYGLSLYKANGQIKTMPELADNLQKSFKDLTPAARNQALGVIFGSRAIQGANILMKDGEKVNRKWIKSVDDQGFAAHQASGKMDSLKGDLQKLDAELGNAFIDQGGKQGFLRGEIQDVTHLVKKYNELSDAQKSLVGKAFVGAAAAGGALWTANKIYKLSKGTAELYRGIGGLLGRTASATTAGKAVGGLGVQKVFVVNWAEGAAAGAATGGAGAAAAEGAAVGATASKAARARKFGLDAIVVATGAAIVAQIGEGLGKLGSPGKEGGVLKNFSKPRDANTAALLGGNAHTLENDANSAVGAQRFGGVFSKIDTTLAGLVGGDGLSKSLANIKKLDAAIAHLQEKNPSAGQEAYAEALKKSGLSAEKFAKIMPKANHEMLVAGGSSKWWDQIAGGLQGAVEKGEKFGKTLKTIPKEIRSYVSTPGSVQSLADMRRIAQQYKLTPKQIRTVMLLQGFSETQARIAAAGKSFQSLPKQVKTALRADTVKSQADVKALQKRYNLTPHQVQTVMHVSGVDTAIAKVRALQREIAAVRSKSVTLETVIRTRHADGGNFAQKPRADGGRLPKGGRYADDLLTPTAPGEFIVSNRHGQVDRNLGQLERINHGYADGGRVSAVSGGTGTASVIVQFPSPAIYATAVKAADDIAAAAVKTTATAKDLRAVHLDDLHQQQQIRDLNKELAEHEKKSVGKGKSRHEVKGKLTLRGLDRTAAKAELADAKATLVEMRKQNDVQKQMADARAEARQAQQDARTDATSSITGGLDLFSHSAAGSVAYVQRYTVDVTKFGNVLARLRSAKASPMLLSRMVDLANSGDFRGATRFGQALLDQPALLASLDASLTSFGQVAGGVANLSTDPRFLTSAAWNPAGQVASVKQVQVTLGVDPSTWITDITRRVTANVLASMNGGG